MLTNTPRPNPLFQFVIPQKKHASLRSTPLTHLLPYSVYFLVSLSLRHIQLRTTPYFAFYQKVCDGSLDRAITLYMESGGIDLSGTTSTSNNNNNNNNSNVSRGERRSRSSSNDGSGDFGGFDQDEELARSLQEEDSRAAQSIRAPIAPRHEMLLGDDYGGHSSSSMFHSGSSRKFGPFFMCLCGLPPCFYGWI
jgi:hypothetical protein